MVNFFISLFVFVVAGLQTVVIEDSLMYRLTQFKEVTYDPSVQHFTEKTDSMGCAILGKQGWIKYPLFSIAVHELAHVRGYGEIIAYSVEVAIFSAYVTIFSLMFYVASEMGDDSSESRCPASLGIRPEGRRAGSKSPQKLSARSLPSYSLQETAREKTKETSRFQVKKMEERKTRVRPHMRMTKSGKCGVEEHERVVHAPDRAREAKERIAERGKEMQQRREENKED